MQQEAVGGCFWGGFWVLFQTGVVFGGVFWVLSQSGVILGGGGVFFGTVDLRRGLWCPPGLSDIPGEAMVKLYCPKCMDVYTPKSSRHHHTDGAYFGTGFPHMLFMVHPEYRPKRPANQFVPRSEFPPQGKPPQKKPPVETAPGFGETVLKKGGRNDPETQKKKTPENLIKVMQK